MTPGTNVWSMTLGWPSVPRIRLISLLSLPITPRIEGRVDCSSLLRFNNLERLRTLFAIACVFYPRPQVYISSMNATGFYFESSMAQESTEIFRGLRDPDLLDRLIERYQHRLLRYLVYLTGHRELAEDPFQETWIHRWIVVLGLVHLYFACVSACQLRHVRSPDPDARFRPGDRPGHRRKGTRVVTRCSPFLSRIRICLVVLLLGQSSVYTFVQ